MEEKILLNDKLDKQLLDKGFVVVPFLNQKEVKQLVDFFNKHHPNGVSGFYATAHASDVAFRNLMNNEIKKVFGRAIADYFHACVPLGGSFVVKSNSQKERLNPHQDWNIVDEERHRSFNIWVPLVNLNENNGVIKVMPESHKWVRNYRGPNLPDHFQDVQEQLWQRMVPLFMKEGEALIYDHRLFHASDPNNTEQLRTAAVFGIIPKDTEMLYYWRNEDKVEVYESSVDFFMNGDMQSGHLQLRKLDSFPLMPISPPEFLILENQNRKTGGQQVSRNPFAGLLKRLISLVD